MVFCAWWPTDKRVRDKALASVRLWLKTHRTSSELDLLKLWKALFYCTHVCCMARYISACIADTFVGSTGMWMSDKVPVQQELAQQLAELVKFAHATTHRTPNTHFPVPLSTDTLPRTPPDPCVTARAGDADVAGFPAHHAA